jgi:hypothetical protein
MEVPKILSDPDKLGGMWVFLHLKAKNATDIHSKQAFIDDMYMLYNEFPCAKCRGHIREYMDSHPFEPFYDIKNKNGKDIGMFKWLWMFHNAVNTRLHKPYLDWQTASEMYNLDGDVILPCTTCGGSSEDLETLPPIDKNKIIQGYFRKNNY